MQQLLLFIRHYATWLVFLLLQSVCLVLIANESRYHRSAISNAAMEWVGHAMTAYRRAIGYLNLRQENQRLAIENSKLRTRLAERLTVADTSFIALSGKQIYEYIPARVVQVTTNASNNYLLIDQGSLAGIEPRMGIIGPEGVVGIVRNVSPHFATAYSLLHKKVSVSARLGDGGARGTVRWDGRSPFYVNLEEIPRQQRVMRGDTVFTSGLSRIFPDRIPIGVVESYYLPVGSNFYQIRVRLTSRYSSLDHVYVVRHLFRKELDSLVQMLEHDQ
ncbi:MAG: rod shape-determining protein MreC [Chitinophagales bacterium]|nr:rod shape-determining protein MreC [Chitinophagales bacterium]MDW8427830.1 rod shape-determining protein MreC [Chitinophagales bacterium]